MRFYDIAFFVLMIQIGTGAVNQLQLFNMISTAPEVNGQNLGAYSSGELASLNTTITGVNAGAVTANTVLANFFNSVFQFTFVLIPMAINFLANMVGGIAIIMQAFGTPPWFALIIQAIVWLIEAIGLLQWASGRSFREAV